MNRYITVIAALVASAALNLTANGQTSEGVAGNPTPVEINRELPRTPTVSYPSEELSLARSGGQSRYFQPITEWARHTDDEGNEIFSAKYKVPFEWVDRQYFLRIGAATSSYVVLVNGEIAGYNQSGRTAAEFDITKSSTEGLNRLEIIVYKDPAARVLQSQTAAPEITGDVYITAQPRIRIRDYVTNALLEGQTTALELGVIVKSHLLNPKTVRVYYSIINPDGTPGPYGHRDADFEMKLEDTVRFFVNIPNPKPWSHETPNLYTLALKLQHEGRFTEYVTYPLALRTAGIEDGEFRVNGYAVPVNAAEYTYNGDIGAAGEQLRALRERGVNTLLLSGYPQPDAFYSLCDSIGMYVCNMADINTATRPDNNTGPANDPRWEEAFTDRVLTMYHTSQYHPSVVMFALGGNSSNGYNLYESYIALKSVEPNRPVVYFDGSGEWNSDALYAAQYEGNARGIAPRVKVITDEADWRSGGIEITPTPAGDPTVELRKQELITNLGTPKGEYGFFNLTNGYYTAPVSELVVEWEVRQGKRVLERGSSTLEGTIKPGETRQMLVGYGKAKPGTPLNVSFTVYRPRETYDPAPPAAKRQKKNDPRSHLIKIAEQGVAVEY